MPTHSTTDPNTTPPVYLTVKDLAARWRCGVSTLYELAHRRQLPWYRLAGRMRFALTDVEAYEAQQRRDAVVRPLRRIGGSHGR